MNLDGLKHDQLDPSRRVEIIGQLLANGVSCQLIQKIGATNAFEIQLVDVQDLREFNSKVDLR